MPILTDINLNALDLRDGAPLVIGRTQREAVAARAGALGRRRRLIQSAVGLATVAALAVGVGVLASSGTGPATNRFHAASPAASPTAQLHGTLTALPAGATAHLDIVGDGGTYQADADVNGSFVIDGIPPGTYEAKVTVDTPSADANLGSARTTHRSSVKLVAGDNQVTVPVN